MRTKPVPIRNAPLPRVQWRAFICAALFAAVAICMQAETSSVTTPGEPMKTFVIIFRQIPPVPSSEERQRIASDVVDWAQGVNAKGHKLDPRILAPEGSVRGEKESAFTSCRRVASYGSALS
jgi:hypothetical protein